MHPAIKSPASGALLLQQPRIPTPNTQRRRLPTQQTHQGPCLCPCPCSCPSSCRPAHSARSCMLGPISASTCARTKQQQHYWYR